MSPSVATLPVSCGPGFGRPAPPPDRSTRGILCTEGYTPWHDGVDDALPTPPTSRWTSNAAPLPPSPSSSPPSHPLTLSPSHPLILSPSPRDSCPPRPLIAPSSLAGLNFTEQAGPDWQWQWGHDPSRCFKSWSSHFAYRVSIFALCKYGNFDIILGPKFAHFSAPHHSTRAL